MSVDFSSLVLGPCMDAFAKPVTVFPIKSQPLGNPYTAQGVWTIDNIGVGIEDGGNFSTRVVKFGIKLDQFAVSPVQYDEISSKVRDLPMGYVSDELDPNATVTFIVDNDQPDGQGGTTLILKRKHA
jgi:hypothetical protein